MHSLSMESTGLRIMIHIHGMRFGGQNYLCIAMALVGLGTAGWKITASVLGEPDLDFNLDLLDRNSSILIWHARLRLL